MAMGGGSDNHEGTCEGNSAGMGRVGCAANTAGAATDSLEYGSTCTRAGISRSTSTSRACEGTVFAEKKRRKRMLICTCAPMASQMQAGPQCACVCEDMYIELAMAERARGATRRPTCICMPLGGDR